MVGWQSSSLKTRGLMIGCWKLVVIGSVLSEERSKPVDGIYLLYSDSLYPCHDQPITLLATIDPLFSQPTGRSADPQWCWYHWIVLCHDSHNPLCLWIHVLCLALSFVTIMSYCTFVSRSWCFCLLSAPLWFHCLHTLYCYLNLASWSMHCPALNFVVYI